MKLHLSCIAAVLFCLCEVAGCQEVEKRWTAGPPQTKKGSVLAAKPVGQSSKWKVTVEAAEKKTSTSPPAEPELTKPGHFMLRIALRLEYLGPAGQSSPPEVVLVDSSGARRKRRNLVQADDTVDWDVIHWFMYGDPRPVKKGETFGGALAFYFEVPNDAKDLGLLFADVPLIKFVPASSRK